MDTQRLWQLFLKTGSPEIYLIYKNASRKRPPNTA